MSDANATELPAMEPITPLGARAPRVDKHGQVTLTEATDTAIASFASRLGNEAKATKALAKFTGLELPAAGRMTEGKGLCVFWTSPDQWMVTASHDSHEDLAAQMKAAAGDTASVTEQNDAWCRYDLAGSGLDAVFERLCPINMRGREAGDATRTSIDHLGCFVLMSGDEAISVFGPRSSAGSLHHALLTAIRSAH
ncbi:MAG: sarcosine oxidase subunit gamma [Rhodobacteraceae bacterium]|nr:sarcosine oxidase subunit gamma [Paracoccaceae bacterium]